MRKVKWVVFAGLVAKICYKMELGGRMYGGGREEEKDAEQRREER